MWTRRRFLASGAFLFLRAEPVRLQLIGEDPGAALGLDEMTRTVSLVGRALDRSAHPEAAVVDLGAHAVSAGGERYSVMASDAARAAALDAWRDRGGVSALEWHHDLTKFGAAQLNERFTRRFDVPMTPSNWMSWMAVKAAVEAQLRSMSLETARYDGHKGAPLLFGPDRHLVQPLCIVDAHGALLGLSAAPRARALVDR